MLSTSLKRQLARKVYPVHRLDHRTSGAILFSFDSKTCSHLQQSLTFGGKDKIINGNIVKGSKKEYIALMRGDWKRKFGEKKEIVIDKPLTVKGLSKEAKTVFRILASSPGTEVKDAKTSDSIFYSPSACSLVLCIPETGRTHQIRRHAHSMGFPIIGDSEHGDSKINRWWRQNRNLNRLFLHCLSLDLPPLEYMESYKKTREGNELRDEKEEMRINNSSSYDRIRCIAPLPDDLSSVLKNSEMSNIWNIARAKDSRLELEPFDTRGGTHGRNFNNP